MQLEARSYFEARLTVVEDLGVKAAIAICLVGLARVAAMQGQAVRAARP